MRWTGFLIVLIGIVATAGVAAATDGRPRDAVDAELLARIGNQPLEAFLAGILAPIRNSADGARLTRAEVEADERFRDASRRASEIGQWLRYDLDGDGAVTMDEIMIGQGAETGGRSRPINAAAIKLQIRQKADRLMRAAMAG